MKRSASVLGIGLWAPLLYAQNCPPVSFQQAPAVQVFDRSTAAALHRQPDGSFTRLRYQSSSPYNKIDSLANFQTSLFNCTGIPPRTFKIPAGWKYLADQPFAASQSYWISDLLGNGTPVGVAAVPPHALLGAPAVDSVLVNVFNADGTAKLHNFYPVAPESSGVLIADVNRDGKKDIVAISAGSTATTGATIAVLLGNGDGTMQPAVMYSAHQIPEAAVIADFNGDGWPDLAVVNIGSSDVSILLGQASGKFAAPVQYPVVGAFAIALGDVNGDGRLDLITAGSKSLSILQGNGDGTFRPAVTVPVSFSATALATGDFNKDGKLDVASIDSIDGILSIVLGNGLNSFSGETDYLAGYDPPSLLVTDVDGDGIPDAVVGCGHPDVLSSGYYSEQVTVFFGRGDGTLIGPSASAVGSQPNSMVLSDLNGDGKLDVAVAASDLWILISAGGGAFKTPVKVPLSVSGTTVRPSGIAAGDFNKDGKQDLAVGDGSGRVVVLLGKGDGTFQPATAYATGGGISAVAVGDFDGDGNLDIVACGGSYSGVGTAGVLLGAGNGTFQSIKPLAGPVWPASLALADFDGDGRLDIAIADEGMPGDDSNVGGVFVYLGLGNGNFQPAVKYAAGNHPSFIVTADFNNDKLPDLIVSTENSNFANSFEFDLGILLGSGKGAFSKTTFQSTDFGPGWLSVGDINGDGKPDLVVAHCCGDTDLTLDFGKGDGTFQTEVHFPAATSPSTVLVADLNGDGKPDIVAGLELASTGFVAAFLRLATTLNNVNGATFQPTPLAPDSFATALGSGLANVTQILTAPYPPNVSGTTVTYTDAAGVSRQAGLSYVSDSQVNYIVPAGTAIGQATVTVNAPGGSYTGSVTVAGIGPGLFLFGGTNLVAANVLRVNADQSQTVEDVFTVNGSGALVPKPVNLSPANSQVYLVLYATGLRGHSSAANSVTVSAGGTSLQVFYAGAQPQYPGLDQIDVLLPQSLAGKGDIVIQVTVDGIAANPGHVTIL